MAAPSPADVLNDVAGAFGLDDPNELGTRWNSVVTFAAGQAYTEVATVFYQKNWSQDQVNTSPAAGNWMRQYALFLALSRGGPPANFPPESLKALNCLERVRDYATVTDATGNPIPPDGTSLVGGIISGVSQAATNVAAANLTRMGYGNYQGWNS